MRLRSKLTSLCGFLCVVLAVSAGCSTPPIATDAGDASHNDIASMDAPLDGPPCTSNADCDDHVFCNGTERCAPSDPAADALGCAPPSSPTCAITDRCDETARMCIPSTDGGPIDGADAASCDEDHDGVRSIACGGADCDDTDALRYPGNPERCGGMLSDGRPAATHDEDCNPCTVTGATPDGDVDHDSFPATSCSNPWIGTTAPIGCDMITVRVGSSAAMVVTGSDCTDSDPNVRPDQAEACNGMDDNCDGSIDEGVTRTNYYPDCDGDMYGAIAGAGITGCAAPMTPPTMCPFGTWAAEHTDCSDTNALVHPGAPEACDSVDNDCNGMVDDGVLISTYYLDCDRDAHGTMTGGVTGCAPPTPAPLVCPSGAWSLTNNDCNDADPRVHGGLVETCDGLDNDCAGGVDDGLPRDTYSPDCDGDGFGVTTGGITGCAAPLVPPSLCPTGAWVANGTDCNDSNASIHPGLTEQCNGIDDNCDGAIDEMVANRTYYPDCDGDLFGASTGGVMGCRAPTTAPSACPGRSWVVDNTDCNDTLATVHPGLTDACNGVDDNCDGTTDEGGLMHPDVDNDGRGDPTITMMHACASGWVFNGDDCDDTRAETYGGAVPAREQCDGRDNDCSMPGAMAGGVQPGEDDDGDRHSTVSAMCLGRGEVGALGSAYPKDDCDDTVATIYTGAVEVCGDGIDQNCDGVIDNPTQSICTDVDNDGHGDPLTRRTIMSCVIPSGSVPDAVCDDCNDTNASVFPGNREVCDRFDNDCFNGGGVATDEDVDGDGHAPLTSTCLGLGEAGVPATAMPRDDCNDGDPARHPGATETCDGQDFNCSSGGGVAADEDADGDYHSAVGAMCIGFGESGAPSTALPKDDCDDSHANVRPGLPASSDTATCDGLDNDCDASTSELAVPCSTGGYCAPGGTCGRGAAVVQISAGFFHTCARLGNGTVSCWGSNSNGQIGSGGATSPTPVPVAGLSGVVEIAAGGRQTCARMGDGTVRCWGEGQAPTVVAGLSGVIRISAGGDNFAAHTCALLRDSTVRCWGANNRGQLGDGTTANQSTPTAVVGLTGVVEISAGGHHTCARLGDGTVRCWGSNSTGQIGDGTGADRRVPATVAGLTGVVQVSAGKVDHTCARLEDGTLRCWGANNWGQLGNGTTTTSLVPTAVTGLSGIAEVSSGGDFTCARLDDGTLRCWGYNYFNQLGGGSKTTAVPGVAGAAQVSTGDQHVCARLGDGSVRCWGRDTESEIGNGTTAFSVPFSVALLSFPVVIELSAGNSHTCARLSDGTIRCWGSNSNGQLGDGTMTNRLTPTAVPGLAAVAELAAGAGHTCARLTDGTVRCWGSGTNGQLGDGTTMGHATPAAVSGLTGTVEVSAGSFHTCARLGDGTVKCWGFGGYGQLGDGTSTDHSSPTAVPALAGAGVVELSLGYDHTCARFGDGTVSCSGFNSRGQLGDGTTTTRSVPTPVPGLSGVVQIAVSGDANRSHSCALLGDGTVRCWGSNGFGEIGDGTSTDRSTPTAVSGLSGVVEIRAGGLSTCARLGDGTVRCWGYNGSGQLGDGTTIARSTPTAVLGLTGVLELSAGYSHMCSRLGDGTVRCWGANAGQLGDGTTTSRRTPTIVWSL